MVIIGFLAIGEESSAGHKVVDAITHVVAFFSNREIDRDIPKPPVSPRTPG